MKEKKYVNLSPWINFSPVTLWMCLDCFYWGLQKVSKTSKFVPFGLFVLWLLPLWSPRRGN